jgi:hypothetical protein
MPNVSSSTLYECIQREKFIDDYKIHIHHLTQEQALHFSRRHFKGLDERLLGNKKFLLQALANTEDKEAFHFISHDLRDDYDILAVSLTHGLTYWTQIPERFKEDRHLAFCGVCGDIESYNKIPAHFRSDRDFTIQCWNHKLRYFYDYDDLYVESLQELLKLKPFWMCVDLIEQYSSAYCKQAPKNWFKLGIILEQWGHDEEMMTQALELHEHFYAFIQPPLNTLDDLYQSIFRNNPPLAGYIFSLCDGEIIHNRTYAKNACLQTGANIKALSHYGEKETQYFQRDFYQEIMLEKPEYYQYLSEAWRNDSTLLVWTVEHCLNDDKKHTIMEHMGTHLLEALNTAPVALNTIHQQLHYLKRYELNEKLNEQYQDNSDDNESDYEDYGRTRLKI